MEKTNMAETAQNQKSLANNIRSQFGQVAPAVPTDGTTKTNILDFRGGQVYIALKAVTAIDEATGQTRDLTPQLLCMFGGHYVDLPINGRWWKEFADFAARLADTFEGVSLENIRTNGDAANAKRLMSKFRSA